VLHATWAVRTKHGGWPHECWSCPYNCFQPVLRLREKARTDSRIIRRWGAAQTPLARLLATEALTAARRHHLEQLRARVNPRSLRQQIYVALEQLLEQPVGRIAWEVTG
jgi:hypothetical protein